MKFDFINKHRGNLSIESACKTLGVSPAGYYKHLKHPGKSRRDEENEIILGLIKQEYEHCKKRIGSPSVTNRLRKMGILVNKKRIERLMKINGIAAQLGRKFKKTTDSNHPNPPSANLVKYIDHPEEPNKVWVTDITYLWTKEGWLYLCIFMDLCTRKIVGWALQDRLKTNLVLEAFRRAVINENPDPGLIIHSDRGVQYASQTFRNELKGKYFQSMSGKGNCYDNAYAESFFHTLKMEWYHRQPLLSKSLAKRDLFEYLEIYYNRDRIHSGNGGMTPIEKEESLKKAA